MSDEFIREIQEDMRRMRAQEMWKKYEKPFFAVAVAALLIAGAHAGWKSYSESRDTKRTHALLSALHETDDVAREKALLAYIDTHEGNHSVLARLNVAALELDAGKTEEARKHYQAIASSTADAALKDLGATQLKALDAAEGKITQATASTGVFHLAEKETQGWGLLQAGKKEEALAVFRELAEHKEASPATQARAQATASYLAEGAAQ